MTALPMEVAVSYQEISHSIEKSISKIEAAVLSALEQTPPELYADIVKNGIYLAGGGALIRGLDKRLTDKIGIQFHIAEDPLLAVAKGTGVALKTSTNSHSLSADLCRRRLCGAAQVWLQPVNINRPINDATTTGTQ